MRDLRQTPGPALRELTTAEQAGYFRGVQPIWGGGLEEERFVAFQRRLAAAPEGAGRYRILGLVSEGGDLLSAFKAYDLAAWCEGQPLRVTGIGAVFTPTALRRQGHAARMLRLALDAARAQGHDAAILFSDIGTRFYERLGFRAVESTECVADVSALPVEGGFAPAAPGDELEMAAVLSVGRAAAGFTLARDGFALRFQLRRLRELARARGVGEPEWGLTVDGAAGKAAAVVRLGKDTVDLLDAAWTTDRARARLLGGLRDCLLRSRRTRLRLWPAHQLRGLFPEKARTSALAMIAPLRDGALRVTSAPDLALLDHI